MGNNKHETLFYCGHCDYATKRKYNLKIHMERKHSHTQEDVNQQTEPSKETVQCNDLIEAVEVWKIYKLLQRMKNK